MRRATERECSELPLNSTPPLTPRAALDPKTSAPAARPEHFVSVAMET